MLTPLPRHVLTCGASGSLRIEEAKKDFPSYPAVAMSNKVPMSYSSVRLGTCSMPDYYKGALFR